MSLLSLIAVFLLEQFQPLPYQRAVAEPLSRLAAWVDSRFNAGAYRYGVLAWSVVVLLPVALLGLAYYVLYRISPVAAWLLNVGALYLTLGFRQFSHHFSEILQALAAGDLDLARRLLAAWQGQSPAKAGSSEIARLAIEQALVLSHRHVFAVLLWFVLLPGPCGAVLYRLSAALADSWRRRAIAGDREFFKFSQQVFGIIDWLPLRATAAAFAVVGDFEDAVYCWRNQASQWVDHDLGIVLASGAGALGVQLGLPVMESGEAVDRSTLGLGAPADVGFMQSAVGLVWRAIVLWMLLLFLLGLASMVG